MAPYVAHLIWEAPFWKATAERVIATIVGSLLAVLTADGFDLINTDWKGIATTVGIAAAVSLLKAILANVATQTGPSLTDSEQVVPPESPKAGRAQGRA